MSNWRTETLAEGITLYQGDMLDILPTLGEFDACVTDPPYGIGMDGGKIGKANYEKLNWDGDTVGQNAVDLIFVHCRAVILWGGNYYTDKLPVAAKWLVWDKQNDPTTFADCELAWSNLTGQTRMVLWLWSGPYMKQKEDRFHPTQKPYGVMNWCIDQLPADVGTILDPFMGSGTTGVAAIKRGKAFYGIEREPKYFEIALRRISDALKAPDMFIPAPAPKAKQEQLL
jgi:DNA modification methylase